ncbi:hypothetical protein GW17_00025138 [Ensete ventricosum]|nr:hypothetical protein GW17_00025138 [Ensete ventricosum]
MGGWSKPIQMENKIWRPAVDRLLLSVIWSPRDSDDLESQPHHRLSYYYYYLMRECELGVQLPPCDASLRFVSFRLWW